jgi:hypothetical protein
MHEFSLETPVEEMDEADLRSTLDEFMQKHDENVSDYQAVEAERDEFSEQVESLEGEVAEFSDTQEALTAKFAEIVARDTPLFEADEVAERFSLDELLVKADNLGLFAVPDADGSGDDPDDDGAGTTFDEKPDRAPTGSGAGEQSGFSAEVEDDLKTILGGF